MTDKKKIGLGTVQFGMHYGISNQQGQTPVSEVKKIIDHAKLNGIEVLDSASGYGSAEKVIGNNNLKSFKIVSKFMPPTLGNEIRVQLEKSLINMHQTSLYGYLAHRPLNLVEHIENWTELQELKKEGKVKKIGFSLNEPDELEKLLQKGFIPDLIQAPYNYFDRRFEDHFIYLKEQGCEVHSRSTFLQGLFFINTNKTDSFFEEVKPIIIELQKNKDTLAGKLLTFVYTKPFIDKIIIGVENKSQLLHNLHSISNTSTLPELKQEISSKILTPSKWPTN